MLEAVINGATVTAECPAAALASKSTATAPPSLVGSETDDHPRRWCCLLETRYVGTAEFHHGTWIHPIADLLTSKLCLNSCDVNELWTDYQQPIAEAPAQERFSSAI
jgi:hypothetical protein